MGRGQLPPAFEAEERTLPDLGDLLHLVSGLTLLGVVRERPTHALPGAEPSEAAPGGRLHAYSSAARVPGPEAARAADSSSSMPGGDAGEQTVPLQQHAGAEAACGCQALRTWPGQQQRMERQREDGSAQTLELLLGEELVAVAVRQKGTGPGLACGKAHGGSRSAAKGATSGQGSAAGSARDSAGPGAASLDQRERGRAPGACSGGVVRVHAADGRLLAEGREGTLRAPACGVQVSVLRSQTPLVRHLYFVAETGAQSPAVQQACHSSGIFMTVAAAVAAKWEPSLPSIY